MRITSMPLLWLYPDCKKLCSKISAPRRLQAKHPIAKFARKIPTFIDKALWCICMGVDDDRFSVNLGRVLHLD